MKITSLNNNLSAQSFRANLFYNNQQLKECLFEDAKIADYGAASTNIYVSGINVERRGYDNHVGINFTLHSPIFGDRTFKNVGTRNIGDKNMKDNTGEAEEYVYRYFTGTGNVLERFENKTLQKTLLKEIKENAKENERSYQANNETDAVKILDKILSDVDKEQEGLSEKRIQELYQIAEEVNQEVVLEGSSALLNKMA